MIIVRYETNTPFTKNIKLHQFATQLAANDFLSHRYPSDARNLTVWVEEEKDTVRQRPTRSHDERKTDTPWWTANCKPLHPDYADTEEPRVLPFIVRKK